MLASSFDAALASQVRLKDAYLGGLKEEQQGDLPHEKEENSGKTDDSESEPWYYKLAPQNNEACGKPLARGTAESVSSEFQKSQSKKGATLEHFFAISPHHSLLYGRPSYDPMEDLDVNVAIWRVFMNATLKAAVHLRNDHDVNLRYGKIFFWRTTGQLFGDMEKLISGQTETTGINLIDSKDLRWISTSLLHSRAHQYSTAKVYVFSDSVLCLGRMGDNPTQFWRNKIQWYSETNYVSELNRIDGKADGVRVEDFPRIHNSGYPQEDSEKRWANYSVIQRISKTVFSLCQCSTTLHGMREEMKNYAK